MERLAGFDVIHEVRAVITLRATSPWDTPKEAEAVYFRLHEEGAADAIVRLCEGQYAVATCDWSHDGPGIASDVADVLGVEFIGNAQFWEKKYGI